MKIYILALSLLLQGCYMTHAPNLSNDEPVYKYNALENRQELTYPDSELRYNVFENNWEYAR